MFKRLYISLIISILEVEKLLIYNQRMHNLYAIFIKILEICKQKDWKPQFILFAKARKRIETVFSQLTDQFMLIRNYAKDTDRLFARIIGKISAFTILQCINKINNNPFGRVKYALSQFRQRVNYIITIEVL